MKGVFFFLRSILARVDTVAHYNHDDQDEFDVSVNTFIHFLVKAQITK